MIAPALLLLAGAVVAVPGLGWLAWWLELGRDERLRDPTAARALAQAADCTFVPTRITLDKAGLGALLVDEQGRVMLLRRHGARFVARVLASHQGIQLERTFLRFALPEPGAVPITLDLGEDAQFWTAGLRRLGGGPAGSAASVEPRP